jgi:hypothetical protein
LNCVDRKDEACLNALGAKRNPNPATAGDFCRRCSNWDIFALVASFHEACLNVLIWKVAQLWMQIVIW